MEGGGDDFCTVLENNNVVGLKNQKTRVSRIQILQIIG